MATSWGSSWMTWSVGTVFEICNDEIVVELVKITQPYLLLYSQRVGQLRILIIRSMLEVSVVPSSSQKKRF